MSASSSGLPRVAIAAYGVAAAAVAALCLALLPRRPWRAAGSGAVGANHVDGGGIDGGAGGGSSSSSTQAAAVDRSSRSAEERFYSPLQSVLKAITEVTTERERSSSTEDMGSSTRRNRRLTSSALDHHDFIMIAARRTWVEKAASRAVPVPLNLWIDYRLWVDRIISARAGRAETFHSFVYAHTLGLPEPRKLKAHWSGSDAADLLACLAEAGLLAGRDVPTQRSAADPADALMRYLEQALNVFDGRFLQARAAASRPPLAARALCAAARARRSLRRRAPAARRPRAAHPSDHPSCPRAACRLVTTSSRAWARASRGSGTARTTSSSWPTRSWACCTGTATGPRSSRCCGWRCSTSTGCGRASC